MVSFKNFLTDKILKLIICTGVALVFLSFLVEGFSLADETSIFLVNQDLSLVTQRKIVNLVKGINWITFGPISEGAIVESIYPHIKGCQLLEQRFTSPSTVVWKVKSNLDGKEDLDVSYLTRGITWKINYQMKLDAEGKSICLSSFLTVENKKGESWMSAELCFGEPIEFKQKEEEEPLAEKKVENKKEVEEVDIDTGEVKVECQSNIVVKKAEEQFIYNLKTPVDLLRNDKKTFLLFYIPEIPVERVYLFDGEKYGDEVRQELSFVNPLSKSSNFCFPQGTLYIYQDTPGGERIYLGKGELNQLFPGQKTWIYLGSARGITGYRVQTFYKEIELTPVEKKAYGKDIAREYEYRLIFSNMRSFPIKIKVIEHFYGLWEILYSEPVNYERKEDKIIYYLDVPANSKRIIRYKAKII